MSVGMAVGVRVGVGMEGGAGARVGIGVGARMGCGEVLGYSGWDELGRRGGIIDNQMSENKKKWRTQQQKQKKKVHLKHDTQNTLHNKRG